MHGGGWCSGDKTKVHFNADNFTGPSRGFVSLNYRLSPDIRKQPSNQPTNNVRYPDHVSDVARGIAWVYRHFTEFRGIPEKIGLIGHSAGGHLVSLVSTGESSLETEGLDLSIIRGTCDLDAATLYIPTRIGAMDRFFPRCVMNAFGEDTLVWAKAYPAENISPDKGIPPMLLIGEVKDFGRVRDHERFHARLLEAGYQAERFTVHLRHGEIKNLIGMIGHDDYRILISMGCQFSPDAEALAIRVTEQIRDFFRWIFAD